jgi:site-specific recombinase XerD
LQHLTTRTPPLRDKTLSSHLRNFFRYLFKAGKTATNLAPAIPSVAQRYGTRLPRHLTTEQVDTLVRAVRTDSAGGRRNYAMVMLLARLGLRGPEVIAMQIDDIDWRSGEVMVRGKGNRHDRVPLPPDVGEALADYIKSDRKTPSRALFVTERGPPRPFKNAQLLNNILRVAFAKTGLKPPAPYVGSHILRHSLATNLVQRGASLEEIGDMLRHRSRASPCFMRGSISTACVRSLSRGRSREVQNEHLVRRTRSLSDHTARPRYDLGTAERILRRFTAFAEHEDTDLISTALFLRWQEAFGCANRHTWSRRLGTVRLFAQWMHGMDQRHEVPPQALIPYRLRRPRPYIYSEEEIRRIVEAAAWLLSPAARQLGRP